VNRTGRSLIAFTLLLGGVSALSGCVSGSIPQPYGGFVVPDVSFVLPFPMLPTGATEYQRNKQRAAGGGGGARGRYLGKPYGGSDWRRSAGRAFGGETRSRSAKGPRRWEITNRSEKPLKLSYTRNNSIEGKTIGPGRRLTLTIGKSGLRYTLRQGKRKKRGSVRPKRGEILRTVWK
jgi:hypothetical protein